MTDPVSWLQAVEAACRLVVFVVFVVWVAMAEEEGGDITAGQLIKISLRISLIAFISQGSYRRTR